MIFAEAIFCKPGSDKIKGSVVFSQYDPNFVRVDINLTGVPGGKPHGIHIHEHPVNFNGPIKLWSPKNPGGTPHGSYAFNTERHLGDMCNNILSINGIVQMSYNDNLISLIPGEPNCILGRSVVIHDETDDEGLYIYKLSDNKKTNKKKKKRSIESKITGNAGKRIGCANIILLNV
jgi:Cu/Zn superoxide dismutase